MSYASRRPVLGELPAGGCAWQPAKRSFDDVRAIMASQWCGCGAQPGAGLVPLDKASMSQPHVMTLPGRGFGPHAFDATIADGIPNVCSDFPLIYNFVDRDLVTDPMDGRYMWTEPSTDSTNAGEPHQPWNYRLGAWP